MIINYRGKTALITGASSGIGAAFAEILAQKGMNLVLVSRSASKLEMLATQLQQQYQIQAEAIATDLSQENAAFSLYQETQKRQLQIDMLINNAGFSTNGNFATISSQKDHQQVMLNVVALVDLTHAFLPDMLTKGEGIIINLGSATSFFPLPYQVVYGASKAFILSFSEALWAEYRQQGIKVLALCPGPTNTNFFKNMGNEIKRQKLEPHIVVEEALKALERGNHYVIPGFRNWLEAAILPRLFTRAFVAKLVGNITQKLRKDLKPIE